MDTEDLVRLNALQNQRRQTQLLEDIKWQMMSPAERKAEVARRKREREQAVIGVCLGIFFIAAFVGALFLWMKYVDYRDNGPLSAKQVSSVIASRKPYAEAPRGISYDKRNSGEQELDFLYSERRLSPDALRLIASSDITFCPYYTLLPEEEDILGKKTKGWIILDRNDAEYAGKFLDNSRLLANSAANIWVAYSKSEHGNLMHWQNHKGALRIDLGNAWQSEVHTVKEEAEQLLGRTGKSVEFVEIPRFSSSH